MTQFTLIASLILSLLILLTRAKEEETKFYVEDENCGIVSTSIPLAFNATESYFGQWPWLVSLFVEKSKESHFVCGSSLISRWHLLSAAHCALHSVEEYYGLLGRHNLSDATEDKSIKRYMSDIYVHEDWNSSAGHFKSKGDIALFRVERQIAFNSLIQPVCLPDINVEILPKSELEGYVVGYGKAEAIGQHQETPKHVALKTLRNWECLELESAYNDIVSEGSFCAGNNYSTPCQGDSGGGFYVLNSTTRIHTTYGIVSHAIGQCDPKKKVAFVSVPFYNKWIRKKIFDDSCERANCSAKEECKVAFGKALCMCPEENNVKYYDKCYIKCSKDADCPDNRTCMKNVCWDSCLMTPDCVKDAHCEVKNHNPKCQCDDGFIDNGHTCDKILLDGELIIKKDDFFCQEDECDLHLTFKILDSTVINLKMLEIRPEQKNASVVEFLIEDENYSKEYLPIKINELFPSIEIYESYYQPLKEIRYENFKGLWNLKRLIITANYKLMIISEHAFDDLTELKNLTVAHYEVGYLPENIFNNNTELEFLTLKFIALSKLTVNYFKSLIQLKELNLDGNDFISLPSDLFVNLHNLEELSVSHNYLKSLPVEIFEKLTKLRNIFLDDNQLETLHENIFVKNLNLERIGLRTNKFYILNWTIFERNWIYVALDHNLCIDKFYGDFYGLEPMPDEERDGMLKDIKEKCQSAIDLRISV